MPQSHGGRGRDYRESDVRMLFHEIGPQWHDWAEPQQWLRTFGPRDDRTRSRDVRELLLEDIGVLEAKKVPFTNDPGQVYKLAHQYRSGGSERIEQPHGGLRK